MHMTLHRIEEASFWPLISTCSNYNLYPSPRTQFVALCCSNNFPVLCAVKPPFPLFQLCCCCFAFIQWIKWSFRGSKYITEERTWSSENLKNILFFSARYLGPLGLSYHFPKMSRLIIPVTSNVRDSILNSPWVILIITPHSYMVFYIFPNAISPMIIITNNTVWKVEQRRQDRYYCPVRETENVKPRD